MLSYWLVMIQCQSTNVWLSWRGPQGTDIVEALLLDSCLLHYNPDWFIRRTLLSSRCSILQTPIHARSKSGGKCSSRCKEMCSGMRGRWTIFWGLWSAWPDSFRNALGPWGLGLFELVSCISGHVLVGRCDFFLYHDARWQIRSCLCRNWWHF